MADLPQVVFGSVLAAYGFTMAMELEPLTRIYLHSRRMAQIGPVSEARRVTVFAAIALFVLLIACVNYMNLATARSLQRAREVGVRKTMGASRRPLVGQFLGESVLTTVLALVVALVLVALAAFITSQRRKEIGVCKVLGASVGSVVVLLSRRFAALVALGFLLGAPIAYLALDRFLTDFPYRISLGPALFVAAGMLALLIALATVTGQALRAAHADPVRALRAE